MKVINLFAGPGASKSTLASYIFFKLKINGYNSEIVTEYAKDKTWEKDFSTLSDQLYVTAKQNRKLERLRNQLDVVVNDSPLLLGIHYSMPGYLGGNFEPMIYSLFDTYENINLFIERKKPYDTRGRTQSEEEAKQIDKKIKSMLINKNYQFDTVEGTQQGIDDYFEKLTSMVENIK